MYYRCMPIASRAPALVLSGLAALAAFHALRLAYADFLFQTGTPENVRRAARIAHSNPTYALRAGDPRRAVALNPYLSEAWLELAQQAEAANDLAEAERLYREASKVDQTFTPRWALANYYFRRQQADEFWRWLRLAAERSYGDRTALFRLAWHFTEDSQEILRKSILPTPEFLGLYLDFLRSEAKWEAAVEAAAELAPMARPGERAKLLELCEALLQAGRGDAAVRVWNLWDPGQRLDAAAGHSLANGDLAREPLGKGFDLRFPWRAGVTHRWSGQARQIRIALDGREQERTELLEQYAPVVPGAAYVYEFRYRVERMAANSGIRWSFSCPDQPDFLEIPVAKAPPDFMAMAAMLRIPPGCRMLRITLGYRRLPGTVRAEGDFILGAPLTLTRTR